MKKRLLASVSSIALLALGLTSPGNAAPQLREDYIITFSDNVNIDNEIAALKSSGAFVNRVYRTVIKGAAASLNDSQVNALSRNPKVLLLEKDAMVSVLGSQSPATWGLDRIDQRDLPLNNTYNFGTDGSGVTAYVIDTGIRASHNEFGGRVRAGYSAIGSGTDDCNGHGTHVAGTIGGSTYGVAEKVNLVPVRVLDCSGSGSWSGVISGIDWVAANANGPSVANLSLGGGASSSVDNAITNLVSAGVTVAVAAGNSNADACASSPARAPAALTVGATTSTDSRASYSNYGTCLDVFAPGSSITSSWNASDTAINTISGTSMASPHVAGVAALYLSANPSSTPAQVSNWIVTNASTGKVISAGTGSPNRLLVNDSVGAPSVTVPSTPVITRLTSSKSGSVSVSWSIASDGGSPLLPTVVSLFSSNGVQVATQTLSGSLTGSASFKAVPRGAGYTITITATNAKGSSSVTSQQFSV